MIICNSNTHRHDNVTEVGVFRDGGDVRHLLDVPLLAGHGALDGRLGGDREPAVRVGVEALGRPHLARRDQRTREVGGDGVIAVIREHHRAHVARRVPHTLEQRRARRAPQREAPATVDAHHLLTRRVGVAGDDTRLDDGRRAVVLEQAIGVDPGANANTICYCGSGVSACLNVLAMERLGFDAPRLFVASWSGWSADPDRPTETGPAQ